MAKRRAIIFLGPSLGHEQARKLLPDADYRPPARKGDLLALSAARRASREEEVVAGLVDGVFLLDYPPTPIEVYQLAVQPNTVLAGAASLGALRAVELEKFGMIGIGRIFRLFKSGRLDADDEVAVTFTENDHRLLSEAMVDIRYNLILALKKGVIDKKTMRAIGRTAKQIYFPHRNYSHILDEARRQHPSLAPGFDDFEKYITSNRTSLKARDAAELLEFVKGRLEA